MTLYLNYPKMYDGTLWLLECFTLGPPCNEKFLPNLVIGLKKHLTSNKPSEKLRIFLVCIMKKYKLDISHNSMNSFEAILPSIDEKLTKIISN